GTRSASPARDSADRSVISIEFHSRIPEYSDFLLPGVVEFSRIRQRAVSGWCSSPKKQNRWERIGHILGKARQVELVAKDCYRNPVAFFVSKLSLRLDLTNNYIQSRWVNLSWYPNQKEVSILRWVL